MPEGNRERVAIWAGERQASMLSGLFDGGRLKPAAIGGEAVTIREEATRLGVAHHDDPRSLANADADATLIADPDRVMPTDVLAAMIAEAERAHRPLLTLAPRPASVEESAELLDSTHLPTPVPTFRDLSAGRRLIDAATAFETPSAAAIECSGPERETAITGRLFDAFDLLSIWFGTPTHVDATAVRPVGTPSSKPTRILAIARFPDGRAASVTAGTEVGRHARMVTLFGASGRLQCIDGRLDWAGPDGTLIDQESRGSTEPADFTTELVESIRTQIRIRSGAEPGRSTDATIDLLATCEAATLSARTGEPESVDAVRRMIGRV